MAGFGLAPLDATLPSMPAVSAPTTGGQDPESTLLTILQQIGALQGQPLIPDNNPLLQIGSALSGFAAGTQGRPNPVMQTLRQERADQISALHQQALIGGTIATMKDRTAQRRLEEQRERRLEDRTKTDNVLKMADPFLKSGTPEGVKFGVSLMRQVPGVSIPEGMEAALSTNGLDKTLRDRLDMAIAALDKNLDPRKIGVNVSGIDLTALQDMSKEDRLGLMSPDAQAKLTNAADHSVKAKMDRLKLEATERIQAGTPQAFDYEITGVKAKTADQVVGTIVEKRLNNLPLSRAESDLYDQWRTTNQLKGLQGNAAVALGKALGLKGYDAAWNALSSQDKSLSEVELLVKAAEAKERSKQPGYVSTLQDRSHIAAAESWLENKGSRPMPPKFQEQLDAGRNIAEHLNTIDDIIERGGTKFLGPVAGGVIGPALSAIGGPFENRDRDALYQAISGVLLEIGPDRFGSAFTKNEREILEGFLAERTNPTGKFKVKMEAVRRLLDRKYKDKLSQAKANKWRIADEYLDLPKRDTSSTAVDAIKEVLTGAGGAR